ncbi:MAG: DUF2244 domain-containing protein [Pseudomonadota bacterium]|nr:DUF2244 domain-containing protein [Pseudomonadota bacterium]
MPHRSLSPKRLRILIAFICGCCCLTLLRMWLIRAWPVMAFSVLEVGLAITLLAINARRARATELVMLTEGLLSVVRTDPAGRKQERRLSPAWLTVVLEERHGQVPRLLLAARDEREEVGTALGEQEKRELASALREALYRVRHPVFDNPQLRES